MQTEETPSNAISPVCANPRLKMFLKYYFSDTASYYKGVAREWLFIILRYDKLIWQNAMQNEFDRQEKVIQVNQARL